MAANIIPRWINTETNAQSAIPAFEITRLNHITKPAFNIINIMTIAMMLIGLLWLALFLVTAQIEKRHDIALLRIMGISRHQLMLTNMLYAVTLTAAALILGVILACIELEAAALYLNMPAVKSSSTGFANHVMPLLFVSLAISLAIGLISGLTSYKMNLPKVLKN